MNTQFVYNKYLISVLDSFSKEEAVAIVKDSLLSLEKYNLKYEGKNIELCGLADIENNIVLVYDRFIFVYTPKNINNRKETIVHRYYRNKNISKVQNDFDAKYFIKVQDNNVFVNSKNRQSVLYYPQVFEYELEKEVNANFDLYFEVNTTKYICKDTGKMKIHCTIPQQLLSKFIEYIDVFANIDKLFIKNVCDLMSYL